MPPSTKPIRKRQVKLAKATLSHTRKPEEIPAGQISGRSTGLRWRRAMFHPNGPLFEAGAAFLRELGVLAHTDQQSGSLPARSFIEKDPKTGGTYLKIPMPKPDVLANLFRTAVFLPEGLRQAFGSGAAR